MFSVRLELDFIQYLTLYCATGVSESHSRRHGKNGLKTISSATYGTRC